MIEIAFSLAIVAFALVAIMGVLPMGMTVQRDNREDTIINHDIAFLMEAVRSGSKGIDDLTNYVESITISNRTANGPWVRVKEWVNTFDAASEIKTGKQIVGLLSTPRWESATVVRSVHARVRALNGSLIEKGNPRNDFAFRYHLYTEVVPMQPTPPNATLEGYVSDANVRSNLWNLRLTAYWPVIQMGNSWGEGGNRRIVSAMMQGLMSSEEVAPNEVHHFVEPNAIAYIATPYVPNQP